MTYIATEQSAHDGQPVELYKFDGSFQDYFYTSGPLPVTFDGNVYVPIALDRSDIAAGTQEDDGLAIQIDLPINSGVVLAYAFSISPPKLNLTIFRFHQIDEWVPYWIGIIGQIKISGGKATMRSPSILETALMGNVPNVYFQTICNNVLFDERCKVVEADWKETVEITAVNQNTLTLDGVGALGGKMVGGEAVLANGESRMIVLQTANIITVNYPYSSAEVGDALTITAGCNLDYEGDCKNRFDNQINYTGFPFIPPENPFQTGIEPGKNVADEACLPTFVPWTIKIEFNFIPGVSGGPPYQFPGLGNHNIDVDGPFFPNGGRITSGQNLTASLGAEDFDMGDGQGLVAVIRDFPDGLGPDATPGGPMATFRRVLTDDGAVISYIWYFYFDFTARFACTHQFGFGGTLPGVGSLTATDSSGHLRGTGGQFDSVPFQANYGHNFPYSYYVDL